MPNYERRRCGGLTERLASSFPSPRERTQRRAVVLVPQTGNADRGPVVVFAVVDDALSPDFPLGVELEVFVRREDAERFVEEVRGDNPELARCLRIEGTGAGGGRAELAQSVGHRRKPRGSRGVPDGG